VEEMIPHTIAYMGKEGEIRKNKWVEDLIKTPEIRCKLDYD